MKFDKEIKQKIDEGVSIGWYVARKVLVRAAVVILVLSVIGTAGGLGYCYWKANTDRMIFKQSVTYNEGVLDDLAKYRFQMEKAEDDVEKAAIAQLVNNRFANFDESKIESYDLRKFLEDCRNGKY